MFGSGSGNRVVSGFAERQSVHGSDGWTCLRRPLAPGSLRRGLESVQSRPLFRSARGDDCALGGAEAPLGGPGDLAALEVVDEIAVERRHEE